MYGWSKLSPGGNGASPTCTIIRNAVHVIGHALTELQVFLRFLPCLSGGRQWPNVGLVWSGLRGFTCNPAFSQNS